MAAFMGKCSFKKKKMLLLFFTGLKEALSMPCYWTSSGVCVTTHGIPSILSLLGYELTGLARGGEQLSRLKRNYAKAVELLVELASLQVGGTLSMFIRCQME